MWMWGILAAPIETHLARLVLGNAIVASLLFPLSPTLCVVYLFEEYTGLINTVEEAKLYLLLALACLVIVIINLIYIAIGLIALQIRRNIKEKRISDGVSNEIL